MRDHGSDHDSPKAAHDWVVWSFEHGAWWGPNHRGYVRDLARAGRYRRAEALSIEANANRRGVIHERAMLFMDAETFR